MVGASSGTTSLKEYLKKYTSNDDKDNKKKKKKKAKPDAAGVLLVDEDPVWQKPVKVYEEEDSADEEKPQVDEDIEVKRMRRLELIRSKRPFGAISEDGSGWVSLSNDPNNIKSEDQNSDISPPRKRRLRNDTPSPEPGQRSDIPEGADLSPVRQSNKSKTKTKTSREPYLEASESDRPSDLSPPRRQQRDKHASSPERGRVPSHSKATDSDISPPRRGSRDSRYQNDSRAPSTADLSPPWKFKNDRSGSVVSSAPSVSDLSPPRKSRKESPMISRHPRTGLVSGTDVKDEIDRKKKEEWLRFKEMDSSVSGRNAEPTYRDKKTGERMSKEEFFKFQKKDRKKEDKPKEIKLEWGKGLAQKREAEARFQEIEEEKNKPFARGRDDADLDSMLKEKVRWGDPMAHLVKKKNLDQLLPDLGDNEKMKESGFIIPQDIPSHSWIKRGLEAAPNRYGIRPGRHWDGVDRSTGYEKELFKRTNEKAATDKEAYMWSVSDM